VIVVKRNNSMRFRILVGRRKFFSKCPATALAGGLLDPLEEASLPGRISYGILTPQLRLHKNFGLQDMVESD
jgi:hypothetical protein